jgi:hypothetical protein
LTEEFTWMGEQVNIVEYWFERSQSDEMHMS